ncbi:tungsten ABC transporter substrate-binding protein [Fervidicella metallireducens AeB]|uniref:Tungsten ABC transporter substrate-binding protein n=1 Tax=Fervidicella metallireducens AeB TaxID=1403537 RepID=A0A017RUX2_9CLOT|nr:substrate-binding domain-containing protein [Fervidicella metallireducens]EYE88224.1 tungsten ABC transporter substrate-binding protein [Fervidicella metallireducens AeB]
MKGSKKFTFHLVIFMSMALFFSSCGKALDKKKSIILATTTSTRDSGLLDFLFPEFTKDTGYAVEVVAVGTGQALKLARDGNADVVLVHAKEEEEKFVSEGFGLKRYEVMYNDFVIVGPKRDPGGIRFVSDAGEALKLIAENKINFISRGDESGTHKFEKKIWNKINIKPSGRWYISAGKGMAEVLAMAEELGGYTITDRATYLSLKEKLNLEILFQKSSDLKNEYGVIAVNPKIHSDANIQGAQNLINWLISQKGQMMIGIYGKDKYGESLFIPDAQK